MLRKVQRLLQQFRVLPSVTKMSEVVGADTESGKRLAEEENAEQEAKKQKTEDVSSTSEPKKVMKRKVAILLSYSGVGYKGMQINKGFETIEEELFRAMTKAEAVTESMAEHLGKMSFQRCARTDKGVSAAGQVVSMKMYLLDDVVDRINQQLPAQIRVMDYKRVINSFDSKNRCDYRTYTYMTPTFAFQPVEQFTTDAYRVKDIVRTMGIFDAWKYCDMRTYIYVLPTFVFTPVEEITIDSYRLKDETIERVNSLLQYYHGSKNFHNFTSGKKYRDPSAVRFIKSFTCSKPFIQDGMEFSTLTVRGQSFMLHQIRKMVGLVLAVIRGLANESVMAKAFEEDKLDIPKAPGLGLVLENVHYDHYNEKWGSDGLHEPLTWESSKNKVEAFKRDFIYPTIITTEKKENTMLSWLGTLPFHSYTNISDGSKMMEAKLELHKAHTEAMEMKQNPDSNTTEPTASNVPSSSTDKQTVDRNEDATETTMVAEGKDAKSKKEEEGNVPDEERLKVKEGITS